MRKWIIRGVLAVLAVVLVALALRPKPVPVDAAEVDKGPLRVTVDEDGMTRVVDRYTLTAPIGGTLRRIELEPGDLVEEQQVVAMLEPTPAPLLDPRTRQELQARLEAAKAAARAQSAEVTAAQDRAQFAKDELGRAEELRLREAITEQALDRARVEARSASSALMSARFAQRVAAHEIELARAALGRARGGDGSEVFEVRAPIRGRLLKLAQESATIVPPGAPLVEIGDVSKLEVVVDVLTEDAVKIPIGAAAELRGWGGEQPLKGHVSKVEPSAFTKVSALGVEEQRVNVIIELDEAHQRLGDQFRVEAAVVIWSAPEVIRVPAGALFRRGEEWAVFVVDGGKARLRKVKTGHRGGLTVEVLEGLEPGTQVILHPSDRISDGTKVSLRKE